MTRPLIVTTLADGTVEEREMDDLEFAEYEAKMEALADHFDRNNAIIEARRNKLANPDHPNISGRA